MSRYTLYICVCVCESDRLFNEGIADNSATFSLPIKKDQEITSYIMQ